MQSSLKSSYFKSYLFCTIFRFRNNLSTFIASNFFQPSLRGKENANSIYRLHPSLKDRRPLSTANRHCGATDHIVTASGDYRFEGGKSLPVRTTAYTYDIDSSANLLERPHSAEGVRQVQLYMWMNGTL